MSAEMPCDEVYDSGNIMLNILFFGIMLIFGVIFILVSKLLQKLVINEISSVTDSLDEFSRGNSSAVIHVGKSTELQKLAKSVNNTIHALKKTVESGARHFKAELGIAKMLQQSALPEKLPEHEHYRICAEMFNAEEVSGNFYDFFTIGKDYVAVLAADVSAKGTDAILYMMMVKNFFRQALQKHSPEEAFNLANEELCKSGRNMPVMAFLGVLNLNTGVMLSFNASYTFPMIKSKDGLPGYSKGMLYSALGESTENHYSALPIQLYSGDKLFLYSDAVIETKNSTDERYGEERLLDRVLSLKGSAEDLIRSIHQSVLGFSERSTPTDDIVLVTLEYM